jgi:hypothetical protein
LGDELYDCLTEEEMEAMAIMNLIFFNLKAEGITGRFAKQFSAVEDVDNDHFELPQIVNAGYERALVQTKPDGSTLIDKAKAELASYYFYA